MFIIEITNPLKAIREKCKDCTCGMLDEIRHCPIPDCPLFPFRMGKNPYRTKRRLSAEEKEKLVQRMTKARQKREKEVEKTNADLH